MDTFSALSESRRYAPAIQKDIADARRLGIAETPGHIINGRLFVGPMSPEIYKKQINKALGR